MKTDKKNQKATATVTATATAIAILTIFLFMLTLSGCADSVEVQDRDFVLALGVSVKDDKYELTFGLPDLSVLTKAKKGGEGEEGEGSDGQARSYESSSLAQIEDLYNHGSNKRLDYRHLDALILDSSISGSPDKLRELLEYMDNNYQIARDVRVFFYSEDVKKLIEQKGAIKGGIGDYLEKLEKNNQRKNGLPAITLGNLIDSVFQEKDILIPIIELKEGKLEVNGGAIFQDSMLRKKLTEEELQIYYIIKGQGKEFNFNLDNGKAFRLKGFYSKTKYKFEDNKPVIYLSIEGAAQNLSANSENMDFTNDINSYLLNAVNNQINICFKSEKLDYLNMYSESSLKNRDIWLAYQNRTMEFINDTNIIVSIDVEIQNREC